MHWGVGRARGLLCADAAADAARLAGVRRGAGLGLIYRRQDTAPAGAETPRRVTLGFGAESGEQDVETTAGGLKLTPVRLTCR